jgi:Ca2+-binding EF-hand superfamily protein
VGNVKTGKINYTEFLMASMDLKKQLSDEVLHNVFAHFDKHNRGYIIASDLLVALQRTGVNATLEDLSVFLQNEEVGNKT